MKKRSAVGVGITAWICVTAAFSSDEKLTVEILEGKSVWVSREVVGVPNRTQPVKIRVWFDKQFLGDGKAYNRRAKEFSKWGRRQLRKQVVQSLQFTSEESYRTAAASIEALIEKNKITDFKRHWIVNGFSCRLSLANVKEIRNIPGVKKIFVEPVRGRPGKETVPPKQLDFPLDGQSKFDPDRYQHPWYVRSLLADRTWKKWGITGKGTLNVIHDFNFFYPEGLVKNLYQNSAEIPGNGLDDDENGWVDDCYGYNFATKSSRLTVLADQGQLQAMHGTMCATIVCGTGTPDSPYEFGIAPEAKWAGVIAGQNLEEAVEWAILQGADTYSMSFSQPNLGEVRSHWRKVMEHGSFCGVYFVSGAGNFAQTALVPKQMRTPEDIPEVVFAAAGVQRDLSRTEFSSKGPVLWQTEHYQDGRVQKPEVCAFNQGLPLLLPNGGIRSAAINGNSFAGPMFCGAIALMLSADPDLLPWDLKQIITSTATDIGPAGIDNQTGHGLINCYRAVKEVLRRKAIREGREPQAFTGREKDDELQIDEYRSQLKKIVVVARLGAGGSAFQAGLRAGDRLLEIDGEMVSESLKKLPSQSKLGGSNVTIKAQRDNQILRLSFDLRSHGVRGLKTIFSGSVFQ
jgi:hypothetical protein